MIPRRSIRVNATPKKTDDEDYEGESTKVLKYACIDRICENDHLLEKMSEQKLSCVECCEEKFDTFYGCGKASCVDEGEPYALCMDCCSGPL